MQIIKKSSSIDGSVKYLIKLDDSQIIESVFFPFSRISSLISKAVFLGCSLNIPSALFNFSNLKYLYQHTDYYGICVSSQAGCSLGCKFCATGNQGFYRNLEKEEIINQVLLAIKDCQPKKIKKLEIVFAGMGEPLLNYKNVAESIKELPEILKNYNVEQVFISIMTAGIIPKIFDLAKDNIKANLFISLHSTNNEKRSEIMPIGKTYKINEILEAASYYQKSMDSRPVRLNYTLIKGINDSAEDVFELERIAQKYNFIPQIKLYNPILSSSYKSTSLAEAKKFIKIFKEHNIPHILDISKGISNNAGCGQLAGNYNPDSTVNY